MKRLIVNIFAAFGTFTIGLGVFSIPLIFLQPPITRAIRALESGLPFDPQKVLTKETSTLEEITPQKSRDLGYLKLSKRNPDGWFSLKIPELLGQVQRHADVDGGFYLGDSLDISYDYWTYENTPNCLRDLGGKYSKRPLLACSRNSTQPPIFQARIDGRSAIIQKCLDSDSATEPFYIYYVTFPRVMVYDGEGFSPGMYNLTIKYQNQQYLPVAESIVRSIAFKHNAIGSDRTP